MQRNLAVIGIGNMARSIIAGILNSDMPISKIIIFDKNPEQYASFPQEIKTIHRAETIAKAVSLADCVLIAVKPQNYDEVLAEIASVPDHFTKLYISIGAGITSHSVSAHLNNACVIRVLPNLPMLIGQGVSVICENPQARSEDFTFVSSIFQCAGSILLINEAEMNRIIGVTSSSPAYVFQFINAIYQGALAQELPDRNLLNAICDVVIGSAQMLKSSSESPEVLIERVASKGGTTEQALNKLKEYCFDEAISEAMKACTNRADELGNAQAKQ